MRRAVVPFVVVVLAVVPCGIATAGMRSASSGRAPSPEAAKAAFGRLLHQLYGGVHGYWTCPPPAVPGRIDCLAEVHGARRWHQVSASASRSHGVIWINRVSAKTWTRHWWPYSRHFILRSDEAQVPGVVSVNGPTYDWGWLASQAGAIKAGRTRQADALDGNDTGLTRFFIFTCSRRASLITCRNPLGDAMRYRP
jgi:hypothetical protein